MSERMRGRPPTRIQGQTPGRGPGRLTRRAVTLGPLALGGMACAGLSACKADPPWHSVDVAGSLPDLSFTMRRASDGREVTQAAYRGRIVLLFFGYTMCPDVCPLTLGNVMRVLARAGAAGKDLRVLFTTVDPVRDTLAVLKDYTAGLDPLGLGRVDGLRGSDNQLARLARRYRVTYAVMPETATRPYTVLHGPSIYVFDRDGKARLMVPKFYDDTADIAGVTADLLRLATG